jgi:hypothetical protein
MSLEDRPRQPDRRALALVAYYGTAVLAGLIVALNVVPYPLDVFVLLGLGFGATLIRGRTAGRDSFSSSITWLSVFIIVWLPLAWVLRHFPFGA